jgi:proline dehydrogenase
MMIDAIAAEGFDCYASVKAPELRLSRDLFRELAKRAQGRGVGLHFDAMGSEDADETFSLIDELRAIHPEVGCTLPGRWRRSIADTDRAIDLNLAVRVVKGEWADHREAELDPRAGSLAVVDRIAGRVRHAAIATHDPTLARNALRRLRSVGTPCELEVLMGYPLQRVLPIAEAERVPVRMYVPFGALSPPYSLSHITKRPRIVAWVMRDLYTVTKFRASRSSGITGRYSRRGSHPQASGSPGNDL